MTVANCKIDLRDRIRDNINEYHAGWYTSKKQAIAVAYSQILKKYPLCKGKI